MYTNPPRQESLRSINILQILGRFSIVLLSLVPFVYTTYRQWPEVQAALVLIYWPQLYIGLGILILFMPMMGFIPWLTLGYLGIHQSLKKISGLYFISQFAKYLPGGIWAYPGRIVAYEASGLDRMKAILSVSREVTALYLGAAVFAFIGAILKLPLQIWMQGAILVGIACSVVVILVTQIPKVWQGLLDWKFFRNSTLVSLSTVQATFSLRWLPVVLMASLIFWLGVGAGFLQLIKAVAPETTITWMEATCIFSLAWCIGFVIFFLPAGFGARELVLSTLLNRFISTGDALAITLLARFWWMAAEALYMAISPLLLDTRRGDGPPSNRKSDKK
jgi:uncharacterized membrane protein YbhN (UPF0104 family)